MLRSLPLLLLVLCSIFCIPAAQAQLTANFSATPLVGCPPTVVQFTDLSTGGATSWSWNFGNSTVSNQQNPSTSYLVPGTYTVTLTVSNGTSSNTKTVVNYISVNPPPVTSFTASATAGCPPFTTTFTQTTNMNAPGNGTYIWNFGNGGTSTTANPTFTYTQPGTYSVTLSVVNSVGCTTTVVQNQLITVYTPPNFNFTSSQTALCNGSGNVTFTPTGTGNPVTWAWTFGDGGTSSQQTPTHAYTTPGLYNVTLIVTDANGCKDTVYKPNHITVANLNGDWQAANGCAGAPITFTNTTPGVVSGVAWDFGDGNGATGSPTSHIYQNGGTYNVRMIVYNGACADTVIKPITVYPKPDASFTFAPLDPCPAPQSITFTNTSTGATSYFWNFANGNFSASAAPPPQYYFGNGIYPVNLIATSANGCTDTAFVPVPILPLEVHISPDSAQGCSPLSVSFSAVAEYGAPIISPNLPYPHPITSYYWDFGDGGTSAQASPTHVYTTAGIYVASCTITTSNGCAAVGYMTVKVGNKPTAAFTAVPTNICTHQPVYFTDQSTGTIDTWYWDFGDGGTGVSPNQTHVYATPGQYTVTLIVSSNGCKDTLTKVNYINVKFPKSDFTVQYACSPITKVMFYNTSQNYTSFIWYFGDGNSTSTVVSPVHTYPGLGSYTAMLVTWNSATGCSDTMNYGINILSLNNDFSANDTTVCFNTPVLFSASINGGSASAIRWIFDSYNTGDTTANIVYTWQTGGYHTVRLLVRDTHGCWDTVTRQNYVLVGHPASGFMVTPNPACAPANVVFADTTQAPGTTILSRTWFFGAGQGSATVLSPTTTHLYTQGGIYDIKLIATDNLGCMDSLEKPAYLDVREPVASFAAANTNACANTPFYFSNFSSGVNPGYFWTFGDGGTSTAQAGVHTYTQPGVYSVRLIVTDDNGCKDTMNKPNYITVSPAPNAAFTMNDTFAICPPLIVNFTNNSTGATTYNWSFGNNQNSVFANPSVTYTTPGVYNIKMVAVNAAGCKDTAYGTARVLGYNGALSYTPKFGCAPLTVTATALVNNVPAFIFDFGDGTTVPNTTGTVTHVYTQPGAYLPKLIMTDNLGCTASSLGLDTIRVDGIYPGFTWTPYPACDKGTITFTDTSKGAYSPLAGRTWKFHDNTTSTLVSPSKYYPAPGTYPITLYTNTVQGCKDTFVSSITIGDIPVISAGPDTVICVGDTATLNPSGGVSYVWSPANSLSCSACTNPLARPLVPTLYTVTGTSAFGCTNKDSVLISLKTHTIADVDTPGEICAGKSVSLHASGGTRYWWSPAASLMNPNTSDPVAFPFVPTVFTVIVKEAGCIADTGYVPLQVNPKPQIDAGPDRTIIAGDPVALTTNGSSFITSYAWTPPETLDCPTCASPTATPPRTTEYTVLVNTAKNCTDTDAVTIFVVCQGSQFYVPNSFSPNGNGVNEMFYPHGRGITTIKRFRIFNRWGELVFSKENFNVNDINSGWDGKYKGEFVSPDVFVYRIEAVCSNGDDLHWQGM